VTETYVQIFTVGDYFIFDLIFTLISIFDFTYT